MKLMVIGGGGREHAIIKKLKAHPEVEVIYALPGNGGMALDCVCVPGIGAKDLDRQVDFAISHQIDYAVVAPDDPLALGAVDRLTAAGIPCFGPDAKAAVIEASKAFSKDLMSRYGIPTAQHQTFDREADAIAYLQTQPMPIVIKADGLALGKGVIIAGTLEEAEQAVRRMMVDRAFGASGQRVVIEAFLEGPEVTVLSFADGQTVVPMMASMDHKRAHDGDRGLNTGGMGTIAPNPYYTPEIAETCMRTIFQPTVDAMRAEGRPFKGCLYFGLILTADGPKVIEYNCRFGDPETQVLLPLMSSDLLEAMMACTEGRLTAEHVGFKDQAACCVVLASEGYPEAYEQGFPIDWGDVDRAAVDVAGARLEGDELLTAGGRVLGVTAVADTLEEAIEDAYQLADTIQFENKFYRHDIGQRALAAKEDLPWY